MPTCRHLPWDLGLCFAGTLLSWAASGLGQAGRAGTGIACWMRALGEENTRRGEVKLLGEVEGNPCQTKRAEGGQRCPKALGRRGGCYDLRNCTMQTHTHTHTAPTMKKGAYCPGWQRPLCVCGGGEPSDSVLSLSPGGAEEDPALNAADHSPFEGTRAGLGRPSTTLRGFSEPLSSQGRGVL